MSLINGIDNDDPKAVLDPIAVFGADPWLPSPVVTGPNQDNKIVSFPQNRIYYATPEAASLVKTMVGGASIVSFNPYANNARYTSNDVYQMIVMADGSKINAGLVAAFFTHGYSLATMIANEISNVAKGN